MTAQVAETLIHNGVEYALCAQPLDEYITQHRPEIKFAWTSTDCWRGYEGTWQIRDRKLYLVKLAGALKGREQYPPTDPDLFTKLFPAAGDVGLFADWFSGKLRCPFGDVLHYVHAGYASIYRHELVLDIRNGVVTGEEVKGGVVPPDYRRMQAD